jgi:hypothetical protein
VEGEEKERETISPRSPRVSLLLCVQGLEDKRNKRERDRGWLARVLLLVGFARKERRKEKEEEERAIWPKFI